MSKKNNRHCAIIYNLFRILFFSSQTITFIPIYAWMMTKLQNVVVALCLQKAESEHVDNEEVVDPVEDVEDKEDEGEEVHGDSVHLKENVKTIVFLS